MLSPVWGAPAYAVRGLLRHCRAASGLASDRCSRSARPPWLQQVSQRWMPETGVWGAGVGVPGECHQDRVILQGGRFAFQMFSAPCPPLSTPVLPWPASLLKAPGFPWSCTFPVFINIHLMIIILSLRHRMPLELWAEGDAVAALKAEVPRARPPARAAQLALGLPRPLSKAHVVALWSCPPMGAWLWSGAGPGKGGGWLCAARTAGAPHDGL